MPGHTPAEQAKNRAIATSQTTSKPRRRVAGARKPRTLPNQASTRARPGVPSQASGTARNKLSDLFKNR